MVERDTKRAIGLAAAGAAGAAAVAAGAAALFGRGLAGIGKSDDGTSFGGAIAEDATGRGRPGDGPDAESRRSGYDVKDAKVGILVKVIVVSVVTMLVSVIGVFVMFSRFDKAFQAPNGALTAEQRAPILPPLPHLQADPYHDIDAVLMEQTQRLTTYGWNDPDHRDAHIPIERAIQQVVGKPLDGSAQADAAGPRGTDAAQPATPAFNADLQQHKPANRMQGEGNIDAAAPNVTEPSAGGTKP